MTNNEDVFREGLRELLRKATRYGTSYASFWDYVTNKITDLHAEVAQSKDQRIAELSELADAAAKSFLARTGERDAAERESSDLREKLAALERIADMRGEALATATRHNGTMLQILKPAEDETVMDAAARLVAELSSSRAEVERLTKERSLHEEVLEDKLRDAMTRLTEALDRCERAEKALADFHEPITGFLHYASIVYTLTDRDAYLLEVPRKWVDTLKAAWTARESLPGQPEGEKA